MILSANSLGTLLFRSTGMIPMELVHKVQNCGLKNIPTIQNPDLGKIFSPKFRYRRVEKRQTEEKRKSKYVTIMIPSTSSTYQNMSLPPAATGYHSHLSSTLWYIHVLGECRLNGPLRKTCQNSLQSIDGINASIFHLAMSFGTSIRVYFLFVLAVCLNLAKSTTSTTLI